MKRRRHDPCAVPGCLDPKPRGNLFCRAHWRAVPAKMRRAINQLWDAMIAVAPSGSMSAKKSAYRAFIEAKQAAVSFIAIKEGLSDVSDA